MPSHFESFDQSVSQWARKADDFGVYGVDVQRARDLATEAGSQTEVFLKTVVLRHLSPRTNFGGCIDGLEIHGVGQSDRDLLHDLRRLCNAAKHDPSWTPSLLDIQGIFSRLGNVFRALAANNVGLLNSERQNRFHQIFWLAVWDHFMGGDSEVHIIAPYRGGRPPTLDMVYVDLVRWDELKATLALVGSVRNEPGLIPTEVLASFGEDSDFHQAVVFEGSFRDLIAVLATFERREDLIPGLRREDDVHSMMQAFILGTLDSVQESSNLSSQQSLADSIARRVVEAYAVPSSYQALNRQSSECASMIMALPEPRRSQVNGPVWVANEEFYRQAASAMSRHPHLPILINSEGTVQLQFTS